MRNQAFTKLYAYSTKLIQVLFRGISNKKIYMLEISNNDVKCGMQHSKFLI